MIGTAVARQPRSRKLITVGFLSSIAGLALYTYLPLRSAYVVAHGLDPTRALAGAGGGIFWNYNDPRTLAGLVHEITGSESQTPAYFLASLNPLHAKDALAALAATLVSNASFWRWSSSPASRRRENWRTALFVATTVGLIFTVVYPNESDIGRYRFLVSWLAVPLLGAFPSDRPPSRRRLASTRLAIALFAGAGAAFARQTHFFEHAPREGGRWIIDAVRPYVPQGAVVVTGWLDATSLAYGAYVDDRFPTHHRFGMASA